MPSDRPLTSFRALTFDCFGTLVDWELGIYTHLSPLLQRLPASHPFHTSRPACLRAFVAHESRIQREQPTLPYSALLSAAYADLAAELHLERPDEAECADFGASVGAWPAFPDTVEALARLGKVYKLVILSNVDRASFGNTVAGPLGGTTFDAIYTAQDVGSYKPDLRNFEFLVRRCGEDLGVRKEEILHTAQSLFHDHEPAKKAGLVSAWIARGTAEGEEEGVMGGKIEEFEGRVDITWRFGTLAEMADAVEEAFRKEGKA
ncbi:HAD-like domain-containing protein [Macrophomina phaseolina]|uniref:HAD-like domain-containing protein n=1 Tax=Macrophomina phaseolina TaxID=35725 RepID=A0ABQ8G145_9PEZI|nr:HAD-like domain-containing protein [Macrophomina phaseolina]